MNRPLPLAATALIAVAATAGACQCGDDPYGPSFQQNVAESFAPCKAAEIKFLAAKHNVQLAFRPCGDNTFSTFAWSPDGLRLYFQLVMSAYVMDADADNKRTDAVPVPSPVGSAAWLTPSRLAIPVVEAEDDAPLRMAIFDRPSEASEEGFTAPGSLTYHPIPGLVDVGQLTRGDAVTTVLFAARPAEDAPLDLYAMDTSSGEVHQPYDFVEPGFDTFTYSPAQDVLVVSRDAEATLYDAADGAAKHTVSDAQRASLHPGGRWLAIESLGEPISVFYQRTWNELSEGARERELARAQRFVDDLPEWTDKEVEPPILSLLDLQTGDRTTLAAFQGDRFQWYEAAEDWGSFMLWGFEGKQLKRNVALVNLGGRLESLENGEIPFGAEAYHAPGTEPPAVRASDRSAGRRALEADADEDAEAPAADEDAPAADDAPTDEAAPAGSDATE